jgi:fatty-acyl-CoA synthase
MGANNFDWAGKWAYYLPDKVAFKAYEEGRSLTYQQLNDKGNALALNLVSKYGLKKGSRIAILAENSMEHILLFVAAQKMGYILVPVNYRLAVPEIDYLLKDASPELLVVEEKYVDKALAAKAIQQIPHAWKLQELKQFCEENRLAEGPQEVDLSEDDPILILYTSGTTGFPKGALYTHKMLFWNSINTAMSLVVNSESRTINCMPLFHTGGWNVLLTPFFHHGGYTCLLNKFDPALVLRLISEEQISIFMGVPTMLKMMEQLPEFERADFSKLLYILVGGEPMPIASIERWHAKDVPIRQGFGMTEVGPNLTSLHHEMATAKKGSIGKPNFYVSVALIDDKGNEVEQGQSGELIFKGPMVTPAYWNKPEATEKAIKDGWFHSGDIARMDEDGYLYIVDRIKNMYISGGENVYPAEVERILQLMEGVSAAAVIGVADEKWGETGKAFIVPSAGTTLNEGEVLNYCKENLAGFKRPKYVVFMDELPKNDTGKIDRKVLKAL